MLTFCIGYYQVLSLAPYQQLISGQSLDYQSKNLISPILPAISSEKAVSGTVVAAEAEQLNLNAELNDTQTYDITLKAGGVLPIKNITIEEIPGTEVVIGGDSLGILLQTKGVTVVGHSAVIDSDGYTIYPAKAAGIEIGDFVTDINGQPINSNAQIQELIDQIGRDGDSCQIILYREGVEQQISSEPIYCSDSKSYRIGLYVRDNTAGIGTLTFYEPKSGIYGALGHAVENLEYGVNDQEIGYIVRAAIQGIKNGVKGDPGEKMGVFIGGSWQGSIVSNGNFGIFGQLDQPLEDDKIRQSLEVAAINQVEEGAAQILTVIEGEQIESFDIEITKTMPEYKQSGKGMIIEVIDQDLLDATGGIIQGMSGSPIIQNGKLIGAVSHVFVNDPSQGYGCFAEWMLEEAGL